MVQEDGGADHCDGGGGFTGGGAESLCKATENGQGGIGTGFCGGSGYFSTGSRSNISSGIPSIGGQGGYAYVKSGSSHSGDSGGDGGFAGRGGTIKVSENAKVYAYNGNMITNEDYSTIYYEYNSDGSQNTTKALAIREKPNEDKFIPCQIFAQNGILRAVYKINAHWGDKKTNNYTYLYNKLGSTLAIATEVSKASASVAGENVLIRNEIIEKEKADPNYVQIKSGYINPETHEFYGVGSGAGYIEISNGTYTVDESMN